jgi:hypothetical protein
LDLELTALTSSPEARSGRNILWSDGVSLSFYPLFVLLQPPLHCLDRDLLPARIVLFAVAIWLRIMDFEACVLMPTARELS